MNPSEARDSDVVGSDVVDNHEEDLDVLHGYCITVTPTLLKRLDIPAGKDGVEFIKEATCFYEGTEKHGLPMYYEPSKNKCISLAEQQKLLSVAEKVTSMGVEEDSKFAYGTCISLGFLAVAGIGLYVKSQKKTQRV